MSVSRVAFRSLAGNVRKLAQTPAVQGLRGLSTLIERKEMAEESRFIRSMEARRQEQLQDRMQKILALEDHHDEKKELLELLDRKEKVTEEQGLIAKFGLNDWKVALPVGLLVGIPAVYNEVIIIDAEFQLAACFILFCTTMYTKVGPMVGKALDSYSNEIHNELKKADEASLAQIHAAIEENQKALSLKDDFQTLYQITDEMANSKAQVMTLAEEHKYREAIVKKLDSLYALEEAASNAIRQRMVKKVKEEVVNNFVNDKKLKENALNQAIAVLAAGQGAKIGKDIVGESFASAFNNYRSTYSKQAPESDEILTQLQKDMAAIAEAPHVEVKGGNVYSSL